MRRTLQTAAGRMLPAVLAAALAAGPAALRAQGAAPDTAVEALVLSGGGSRGIAHAGTLLGLERLGYDPDLVVGTSMGALVGALYAAGYTPEQIQERIRAIDWGEIFTTAPLVMGPEREARYPLIVYDRQSDPLRFNRGIVPQWRINRALVRLLFDAEARSRGDFDRLARRYRAVAADLQTGGVVVLGRGDLARAARASMAVPGIFAPVEWEGRSLVDGGIASNLPTDAARSLGAGRIVAVDVSRAPARIQGRGALQVASRALDLLLDNAEQSRTPADLLILPELSPRATGITFPDDPEPLFTAGLAATAGVPRSARRRPAPRPLPGPPAAFGSLLVEAPDSATAALARRVFRRVAPGAYDPAEVLDAVDRLYTTGLFEGVWPRIEEGAAGAAPALIVRLDAPPRLTLAGAAGYDTDRGGRLWASLQRSGSLMGAPTVVAASASLDRPQQWVALGGRMHAARISPVVATAGVYRREVDVRRGEERAGDDEVVRLGAWAGVEYQQLLAQRVASAVVRVEDVAVEGGGGGLSVGPLLRIAVPVADFPVVGTTFLAEVEARGGEVAYRRGALRGSLGRRLGSLRVAAVGDVAAASAGTPVDALPALGDEHALPGFRWGEGRGRTRVIVGADAAYPVLGSAYARARVRVGGVADGLGDFADAEPWITGGEAAVVRSTPFGLLSLALQANTAGESRVVFDIGQRF